MLLCYSRVAAYDFRRVPGTGVRLRDRARRALRGRVADPGDDGRRAGGELHQPRGVPDADQDDGLVQAGGRGAAAHTARVRLERGQPAVLQPRRQLADGQLQVSLHAVGRVLGAGPEARVQELQRHREQRRVQRSSEHPVAQRAK